MQYWQILSSEHINNKTTENTKLRLTAVLNSLNLDFKALLTHNMSSVASEAEVKDRDK